MRAATIQKQQIKRTLRFALPAIGAFLLGVCPGMHWLEWHARTSPVFLESGTQLGIILMLAIGGAVLWIVLFRLVSWTEPVGTDVFLVLGCGLLFAVIGFLYLLTIIARG